MTVYIDSDYCCHTDPAQDRTAVESDFFDGKCKTFIEGFRYVPNGAVWVRKDGKQFSGIMISPTKNSEILYEVQEQYKKDQEQMADMAQALEILGVNP